MSTSYLVFRTNPLVSILFTFATNLSYRTLSLSLLKSTGTGTNFSMSNLSTSVFRLAKFYFSAKLVKSVCEIYLI